MTPIGPLTIMRRFFDVWVSDVSGRQQATHVSLLSFFLSFLSLTLSDRSFSSRAKQSICLSFQFFRQRRRKRNHCQNHQNRKVGREGRRGGVSQLSSAQLNGSVGRDSTSHRLLANDIQSSTAHGHDDPSVRSSFRSVRCVALSRSGTQ